MIISITFKTWFAKLVELTREMRKKVLSAAGF